MIDLFLNNPQRSYRIDERIISKTGDDYEVLDRIGCGGNGVVYECIDRAGSVYAVKFLLSLSQKSKTRFSQEVLLMQKANHPHLIRYIADGTVEAVENNRYKNIVEIDFVIMEKADRNLLDYMKSNEKPEYEEYAPQFRGLCEALAVLHQFAIHRDIKPENILIKGETWVLSDFGLCSFLSLEDHQDITKLNEKVGPMFWMSPEAIDCYYFGGKEIGKYSDVFQICLVFVFVLTHKYPGGIFSAEDIDTTPLIKELILEAISNDYHKRPQDGIELVEKFNNATYYQ